MRHLMLLLLASTSCAPAVGAASRPVPASAPVVPDGVTCDAPCLRELLAGVELELGDERAKTAGAEQRAAAAEDKKILVGVLGAVVGAVLTVIAAFFGGK
jgi:hypothetical protein